MQVESTPTTQPTLAGKGCKMGQASILMVSHCGLAISTLKSILKQKKNYGNSNISPCKNMQIFKQIPLKRNQNPSGYYNSIITNLKFQHKPKYHLSKILISKWTYYYLGAKIP